MTIAAIDTHYRGCYFRSRLEARWALAFDMLRIKWRYEPEAYRVGDGLAYLPDFHLPELGTWVEVKGDEADFTAKADVYAAAVHPETGLPGIANSVETTRGLLILGPVPDIKPNSRRPFHTLIQHGEFWDANAGRDTTAMWRSWAVFTEDARIAVAAVDSEHPVPADLPPAGRLGYTETVRAPGFPFGPNNVAAAYAIARAARFDQGTKALGESINAAVTRFKEDLEDCDRMLETDEFWERSGDMETAESPRRKRAKSVPTTGPGR